MRARFAETLSALHATDIEDSFGILRDVLARERDTEDVEQRQHPNREMNAASDREAWKCLAIGAKVQMVNLDIVSHFFSLFVWVFSLTPRITGS